MKLSQNELNQKLREINEKKILNGNGFLMQGTNKIGKDMCPLLQDGEEIVDFFDARISSLFKAFKGTRYARCYIVITTRRIIYIERGNMIMSLNPLAKKTISIERAGVVGEVVNNNGLEKRTYPYLMRICSNGTQYEIAVSNDVSAYLQMGETTDEVTEKSVQDMTQTNATNQPVKKSKKTPIVGLAIAVAAGLILFALWDGDETEDNNKTEVVPLSSYEDGFSGWEATGFEGSVNTEITIPAPITNTDINNYAVYIGGGRIHAGVIMQRNEAHISEWDWLMNALPDSDTQAYYFNCTLTYTGQNVGSSDLPVFIIDDIVSYNEDREADTRDYATVTNNAASVSDETITDESTNTVSPNEVDYDEVYGEILEQAYLSAGNSESFMWILYDINKDGYIEMFVQSGTPNEDMQYTVWTTDGICATELGNIYGQVSFYQYQDGNGVYLDYCNMGYEQITKVSIQGYELEEEVIYAGESSYGYGYDEDGTALDELRYAIPIYTRDDIELSDEAIADESVDAVNPDDVNYDEIYGWVLEDAYMEAEYPEYCYWAMYDIDKDGYSELLVQSGTSNGDMIYTVWTTDGINAVELGDFYGQVSLYQYQDGNGVYTDYCNMGYEQITKVSIDNDELVEETIYEGESSYGYGYDESGTALDELRYSIQSNSLDEIF